MRNFTRTQVGGDDPPRTLRRIFTRAQVCEGDPDPNPAPDSEAEGEEPGKRQGKEAGEGSKRRKGPSRLTPTRPQQDQTHPHPPATAPPDTPRAQPPDPPPRADPHQGPTRSTARTPPPHHA